MEIMSESTPPRNIFAFKDNFSTDGKDVKGKQPLKQPRSAFMCFVDAKRSEYLERDDMPQKKKEVLRIVAKEWRSLSDKDRAYWDEEARNDKLRYVRETKQFNGEIPIPKKRAKKHPHAPKRPMSAFLKYAQEKRAEVKAANPKLNNTDVSSLLGEMWNNAPESEKAPYIERELIDRNDYKRRVQEWREQQTKEDAASRASHQMVQQVSYNQERSSFEPYSRVHSVEEAVQKVDSSFASFPMEEYPVEPIQPHFPPPGFPKSGVAYDIYRSRDGQVSSHRPRNHQQTGSGQLYHHQPFRAYSTSGSGGIHSHPLPKTALSQEPNGDADRAPYHHATTSKYFDRPHHSSYGFYKYP